MTYGVFLFVICRPQVASLQGKTIEQHVKKATRANTASRVVSYASGVAEHPSNLFSIFKDPKRRLAIQF